MPRRRDPLADYRNRRDFAATPEPAGRERRRPAAGEPLFVVQRHEASALHWDLRLEIGGALASWAVPKGMPAGPGVRRLAVRTEDHPLAYADFEGTIPPGAYGAGTMAIVDRGPLSFRADPAAGLADGKLEFVLGGSVLRGEWHLVRIASGDWLLLKHRDRFARGADEALFPFALFREPVRALPRSFRPMLPAGEAAPFDDRGWAFLPELAGARVGVRIALGEAHLRGAGRDLTPLVPEIAAELERVRATAALLDGVLVAPGEDLRPSAERLAARLAGDRSVEAQLYLLDILHFEEWRLADRPLAERLRALRAVVPELPRCPRVDPVIGEGLALAESARQAGLAALWARRLAAPYRESEAWLRIPVSAGGRTARRTAPAGGRVRITRRDKVYFPERGLTKGELLDYYAAVAPLLLPHLADRPLHLRRFPDGIGGEGFYHKDAPAHTPSWVATVTLPTGAGELRLHLCPDVETLLYLVNLGSIDLHPWLSRVAAPDSPDHLVLDLDPGAAGFERTVRVARCARRLLEGAGLRPLLKTSGSRGLHIHVGLAPGYGYDQAAMFAEMAARLVVRELPEIATVERAPARRGDRVYVDFGQNRRGQTVVPPYVVRPVPAASVAVPLEWDELDPARPPESFPFPEALARFDERGDLFAPLLAGGHSLEPAIEALAAELGRRRPRDR